ncbi:hypothetical protein CAEBREN_22815 [Caenorhabditis brenneri]|uniref:Uncharacterized protein n=1 Tax=Caenorhabditis brenneri TaxID=135651 RepID=G0NCT8_CAEBE|nr:hypothetical protein CAEBREN_22815 [Caenorhabditis brenneri]
MEKMDEDDESPTPPKGPPPKKRRSTATLNELTSPKRVKTTAESGKNEFEEIMPKVRGDDKELAVKAAKKLKTMLPNAAKINGFVSHKKNIEDLVAVFSRETGLLGTSMYHEDLHKYSISILANCCYTDKTTSTGMQIRKASRSFLDQAGK